jgi:hypothetical protein
MPDTEQHRQRAGEPDDDSQQLHLPEVGKGRHPFAEQMDTGERDRADKRGDDPVGFAVADTAGRHAVADGDEHQQNGDDDEEPGS